MSELFNASSTINNELGLLTSRKQESDLLISPRNRDDGYFSPNVTIFSQLENMKKNDTQGIIEQPFSTKSKDDQILIKDISKKPKFIKKGFKTKKEISRNIVSLNYLNQRDSSLDQSPLRIKGLNASSSDKEELEINQKEKQGIKRTSTLSNILLNDKVITQDKTTLSNINQNQASTTQMFQANDDMQQNQIENQIKSNQDITDQIQQDSQQNEFNINGSNKANINDDNNNNNFNNKGTTANNNNNNNAINNSSSQGNGNSNPTTSQKQINDSMEFQRKTSNHSIKTQQYSNTPKMVKRNSRNKKNLTCATTFQQSPPGGTPLRGSKNRIFPQINNSLQNSPYIGSSSTPQQPQREIQTMGRSKSMYNSIKKSQKLAGDQQQIQTNQFLGQRDALSPTQQGGQILFSNGTLNTQFDRRQTLIQPYATNTMNELLINNSQSINFLKQWNIATRVKMINRFYQKVKNQTSQINFKYLQKKHFDLIDDPACCMFDESNNRFNQQQQTTIAKIIQFFYILAIKITKLPVLSPNAQLIRYWRSFYTSLLLLQIFLIPFQISFSIIFNTGNYAYLLYYTPLIAYCFNIFVCLNTGYYEMGIEQLNRSKVFKNYKNQCLIDILVIISFILTNTLEQPFFNLLFYLKFYQLYSYFQDIVEYYKIHEKFSHVYTLAKLIFLILFVAHSCGCIFQFISIQEINAGNQQTWLVQAGIYDNGIAERYLNSLYFSIITMITVGYGDIKPIADSEKMFTIFMALLGSIVFAYVVNTIGGIFQEIAQKEAEFIKKKYDLSIYMSTRQIKQDIQLRVMKFLDYKRMKEQDNPMRGEYILNQLSENLKEEIQKDFFGRILQSTKVFSSKFSSQFLNQVSLHFKEKVLGPGEIVFRQQSYGENDIYFILKGQVEIFLQSGQQTRHISYVKAGQFFGQGGFFSSSPRETCCKSTSTTHVIVLPQSKFIETLKDFPQDFEIYSQIKDEMVLYNKKESMACLSCGKYNHSLNNCHFIHYKRNRDLLIARYTYSVPNERRAYKRYAKSFQTLKMNIDARQNLKQLRQNVIEYTIDKRLKQQAIDDSDRDELIQTKVQLTNIQSDKKFFQKAKKIKYDDEKNIIAYSDDEDIESQLGEITECSCYSSEDEESRFASENEEEDDDDHDIQEADMDQEESHTQNEIQSDLIQQRKDEDALNSIQEEGEDGNDESKKNSQSRNSSVNIYREKLNQFMINLQQEGKINQSDDISKHNEQKLGISELSSSNSSSSSESNLSHQENQVLKLQVSGEESNQSFRSRSESSPNNVGEQSFQIREKSRTAIKQKQKQKNKNKQISSNKSISNGDEIKLSRENSNNSSLKRDYDRQLSNDLSQKNINIKTKSKNNSSGQDSINKQTDKGCSASVSSKKKKRDKQNMTQSSKTNSNNQSNASSIQSNSQIIQQVLKGNILKSLNNSNQSSFINNTNSISFGNSNSLSFCNTNSLSFGNTNNNKNKKKHQSNLNIQVLNSLAQLHKKEGILDDTSQSKSSKQQNKFKFQDVNTNQPRNNSIQQNSITFAAFLQNQLPQLNLNLGNQELNSLYNDNLEDFNTESQFNNFLMVQSQSNQNIEQDPNSYNTSNILKQDQSEAKNTPKKVVNKGFFQFGSQNYDDDDQSQQQPSKYKQHLNTPKNINNSQIKQDCNQYPLSFSNLNKIRSQSSASAPNQALDKLKKKSLLSREQSYRSLRSKLSRESKLLQVQEVEELIQNKKPAMNQQLGMTKFSAALSDWNATPILKHINGLMGINNTNNYDQESSISLGGFNTPGRSIKGLQQGNRNSIFNTTSCMDENNDDNQSISSPYQNISSSNNNNNLNSQQAQQLLQQSVSNKKSKFAPSQQGQQKRPSINQHLNQNENPSENQAFQSQNDSSLPNINIERIKKEQERIRRNSPFLMSKHPLSGILPPRNSIKIQNDKTDQKGRRSSIYSNKNQMAPLQSNSNNNNSNNLQSNPSFQQNFNNEEIIQKLKDLFLLRNTEDEKSNEALTKRGSTLYGSEQNFYMQHPLYDYNMFFFPDFDVMKEYEKYFKHNNFSEVLKKVKGKYKVIRRNQKTQLLKRKNLLVHTYSLSGIGKID